MVVKIHGFSKSTATLCVATVCKELDVPFELVPVNLSQGEHKRPEFLAHQPFGQVPYIEDDGFELYESRAICRYLAAKYGNGKLVPTDPRKNALFEQAVSTETCHFDVHAFPLVFELHFKPMFGFTTDKARAVELQKKLEEKMVVYEAILGKQKYLAGDEITLADLFHLPVGSIAANALKLDFFTSKPNIARWWSDISSKPSWKSVQDGI